MPRYGRLAKNGATGTEAFVRALDVFADLMRVVDGSEAAEEIALVTAALPERNRSPRRSCSGTQLPGPPLYCPIWTASPLLQRWNASSKC